MSYNQARKIVIENFRDLSAQVRRDSIKFTADGRGDYLPTGEYTLDLRILEHVTIQRFFHSHGKQPYYYYHLMLDGRDPIRARDAGGRALHDCNTIGCSSIYDTSYPYAVLYLANLRLADDAPRAQAFADGLKRWQPMLASPTASAKRNGANFSRRPQPGGHSQQSLQFQMR